MANALNRRREDFVQEWLKSGNATDAYMKIYPTQCRDHAREYAHKLMRDPRIKARIAELQAEAAKVFGINAEQLLKMLLRAYKTSEEAKRPASMVTAVMGMARITGLDKQIVEHRGSGPINLVINRPDGA